MSRWCVAAVSGATCSGKTTIARRLHASLAGSRLISQDDYFLPESDPRHRLVPGLDHFNWDTLSALDMDRLLADVTALTATSPPGILILEGFLVLNDGRVRQRCDARVFVTLDRATCWQRRQRRVYEPPDVPGYFDACVWPMYEQHEAALRREAEAEVTFLDGRRPIDELCRLVEAEVDKARVSCGLEKAAPPGGGGD
ncbi:nicotinamide riboside kinase 1-like [Amphibalanus amphitrite]|uniref:nicotinamide riboside kinase 1-like n=1 Tax=Amphibalanus amphitrite TaxID=1232801 RepID=UPI001C919AC7|nr:nicotinamide riboside kinase 1-like [Amphibalanus amphitrite]XP_043206752.1 nicotinamide riboside kinase 1-like [Amphibalanus amphitrite]XP_043206753.1 nicotinamide riboside kinase 1-like [Amphibalanus amphitrite]